MNQGVWGSINWVVETAKMEMSSISSTLSELVPGVSCTSITMASAEEFVVNRSSDYDGDNSDQEERIHLQEPQVSGQLLVQEETIATAGRAAVVVQPPEDNLLDLNAEPTGHATAAATAAPAAPPVMVQEDLVDLTYLTEVVPTTAAPAPEMVPSTSDLAGLDLGQAVASNPAPDKQLLGLSVAAEPVTSTAAPSHTEDLLDLDQSWTQSTNAAAHTNIPRLDSPLVSSCSMAAPLPGNVDRQAEALLA